MEVNITKLFNTINPSYYSASIAELGDNAGRFTWENAKERAEEGAPLILETEDQKEAFRDFARSSGGWSNEEVSAWGDVELNALCLQWIAGDMREAGLFVGMDNEDWQNYENLVEAGQVAGNIFGGPLSIDGQVYFSF